MPQPKTFQNRRGRTEYDAFSLLVRFDPDNETQTRIVMAVAQPVFDSYRNLAS
jgi:hypothetical protein